MSVTVKNACSYHISHWHSIEFPKSLAIRAHTHARIRTQFSSLAVRRSCDYYRRFTIVSSILTLDTSSSFSFDCLAFVYVVVGSVFTSIITHTRSPCPMTENSFRSCHAPNSTKKKHHFYSWFAYGFCLLCVGLLLLAPVCQLVLLTLERSVFIIGPTAVDARTFQIDVNSICIRRSR